MFSGLFQGKNMINYWEKGSWNFRKNFHFLYASGGATLNSSLFLVLSHVTAFFLL